MKQVSISVPEALIPKIDAALEAEKERADAALDTPAFRTRGDFVVMGARAVLAAVTGSPVTVKLDMTALIAAMDGAAKNAAAEAVAEAVVGAVAPQAEATRHPWVQPPPPIETDDNEA